VAVSTCDPVPRWFPLNVPDTPRNQRTADKVLPEFSAWPTTGQIYPGPKVGA
jgi:hypothetical protein